MAGLVALLGRPLLPDEGGAGAAHPPARPGRRREPQRLRLHRRLHPVGLHPPRRLRGRGRGRPVRELPGARPRGPRALQPRLRREAALRPHRQTGADRGAGVRLLPLPARLPATSGPGRPRRCGPGATDISFFASDNPRFTNRRLYDAMLAIARTVRGARLPAPPSDPEQLVALRHRQRGAGAARAPGRGALPHLRRRALHHLLAARGAGRRRVQLRRRHPPGAPSRPAWPGRARSGCRAATRSTPASPRPWPPGCAPAAR